MHTVELKKPVTDSRWNLDRGIYLMEDLSAFELCVAADRGSSSAKPFDGVSKCLTPTSLLLISNCGFGDALMWIPALRAFKTKFPDCALTLCTRSRIHPVFEGLDFAPRLVDYPISWEHAQQYERIICSEHLQEDESEQAKTKPAITIKAELLGVGPLIGGERKIQYVVKPEETLKVLGLFPKTTRKRIVVQAASTSPLRNYSHQNMGRVLTLLYDKGYEVLLTGTDTLYAENPIPKAKRDMIIDTTKAGMSFRETAALMATADCVLSMDSSAVHVCGALNIPCVALFASTHWKVRTLDYESVFVIQGAGPCSPCFIHPKGSQLWPKGMPCETAGMCVPLQMILPEQVVDKIEQKLKP